MAKHKGLLEEARDEVEDMGRLLDLGTVSIETAKNKIYTKSTHNLHL